MNVIASIQAREILDSRGNPTVEADVVLRDGARGRASVPSGASTGTREAIERRDGDGMRFRGKGVQNVVATIRDEIATAVVGVDLADQGDLDRRLIELDGTENKGRCGANALLAVSMAWARASAASQGIPVFQALDPSSCELPIPNFNVLNGGAHADNSVDMQEFMVAPVGARTFGEALRMGAEVYAALKSLLRARGLATGVGDEGGFAPNLKSNEHAMDLIVEAIGQAGYFPGRDVVIALDPAASEFYEDGRYAFKKSNGGVRSTEQMIDLWEGWLSRYPIASIEDGLAEQDWAGWRQLTERLGGRVQLVGDDIFVTNPAIVRRAIAENVGNAVLIKLNQIGTVTETLDTIRIAKAAGLATVISHRSGETTDDFIAHLAVGAGAGQIKSGAPCRGERLAKYNELARIEETLGAAARYPGTRSPLVARMRKGT